MKNFRLISALVAVLLVLVVIFQNTQPVTTKVLFFAVTMPNAVMIGITLLIGIAAGMLGALALSAKKSGAKSTPPRPTAGRGD